MVTPVTSDQVKKLTRKKRRKKRTGPSFDWGEIKKITTISPSQLKMAIKKAGRKFFLLLVVVLIGINFDDVTISMLAK